MKTQLKPDLSTFRKKFRFDESSYKYARFILSYAPVVLFGWGVWVFGNTTFISTNNIIEGKPPLPISNPSC